MVDRPFLFLARVLAFLAFIGLGSPAWAHDPGLSSTTISVFSEHVEIVTTFAEADARWLVSDDAEAAAKMNPDEIFAALTKKAAVLWQLRSSSGQVLPNQTKVAAVPGNNIVVTQRFEWAHSEYVKFSTTIFDLLPAGHREHATVFRGNDSALVTKLLNGDDAQIEANLL
jgi:hypothetical protein